MSRITDDLDAAGERLDLPSALRDAAVVGADPVAVDAAAKALEGGADVATAARAALLAIGAQDRALSAIVFSVDKFMSEVRALTNITGNGVATVVVSWWEGELDRDKLQANLSQTVDTSNVETAVTTG